MALLMIIQLVLYDDVEDSLSVASERLIYAAKGGQLQRLATMRHQGVLVGSLFHVRQERRHVPPGEIELAQL